MKTLLNPNRATRYAATLVGLAAVMAVPAAATPLALTKTYEGNISFAGTQASLQSKAGGAKVCDLASSATASIALPKDASVVAATLYWTGTGAVDTDVLLNGSGVTAPAERRYASTIDGFTYFSAAADVTELVKDKTAFTFSGLAVDTSDTYCAKQQKENSMVAGFALTVVYAHKDERYRTVNVYEGLQAIKYASVKVAMPHYTPTAENTGSGKFGYIVWEGDKTGNQKGDHVSFAGKLLTAEPFIHKDNAFNAKSGANSDETSLGIDFDIVDLAAPPATVADANAVFTTESDRVLLGTAIAALPSKPADLAIKKSQAGEFKPGNEITYTLEVSNKGARSDSKVEVKDTLPAALSYVSAGGTDWSCALSGQLVTCAYGKGLAPGATASVQIKAKIIGDGKIVNTAEVFGTADSVPGNNTSKVEGDAGGQPVSKAPYVFTVGECKPDVVIKPAGETGCALFNGPVIAGSTPTIYLTYAVNGIAKPLDAAADKSMTLHFSLECNNPATTAGTGASYGGVALGACVNNDAPVQATSSTAVTLKFLKGAASAPASFHYPDVGIVTLRTLDPAGNIIATSFASLPTALRVAYQRMDGILNPGQASLAEGAFAEAGEPFQVIVSALGQGGIGPLKNFGRESGAYAPGERIKVFTAEGELEQKLLVPQDEWRDAGLVKRTFVWNEAGMAKLGTRLEGYLGMEKALGTDPVPVGRFYPQYFKTETERGFDCLKRMNCPLDAPNTIVRAAFSKQPFDATVRAYGRNGILQRFTDALVPGISLTAVSAAGELGKELDSKFVDGGPATATARVLSYGLARPFVAREAARDWTPPTAVYVRATAQELRKTASGAEVQTISSLRPKDIVSQEGGIMVINGRLMVGNTIGTPLAKTAVPLRAQYWSGLAWEQNGGVDDAEPVMGEVVFSACRRSLRLGTAGDACNTSIVKVLGSAADARTVALPMLNDGRSSLILAPVGDKSGNVDVVVNGYDYLPSTVGRVSFGQFQSPVIYVREMY